MGSRRRECDSRRNRRRDGVRSRCVACESLEPRLALSAAPFAPDIRPSLSAEAEPAVDLSVQVGGPLDLQAGDAAEFSVTVSNGGTETPTAGRLILHLPDELQLTRVDRPGNEAFTLDGRRLDIELGDLPGTGQTVFVLGGTIDSAADRAVNFSATVVSGTSEADLSNNFATLLVDIAPDSDPVAAPTAVDLASASDSGPSAADNITNASTLTVDVAGVQPGAFVQVLVNGTPAGSTTAAGSTASVEIGNPAIEADGIYLITAQQRVDEQSSPSATPLLVIVDRTAPVPLEPAVPNTIAVDQQIHVDFFHSEEDDGLSYNMVDGPITATVNPSTGLFKWKPTASEAGEHNLRIRAGDAAGNFTEVGDTILVTSSFDAGIRLEATNSEGVPVETLSVGSTFDLRVFAQDLRAGSPLGVFSAYVDLTFDPLRLKPVGPDPFEYGPDFNHGRSGEIARPGLIDELGAFQSKFEPTNLDEQLLAIVRFEVVTAGDTSISSRFASEIGHGIALFGAQAETPPNRTNYTTASIRAVDNLLARNDFLVMDEDAVIALDVLANDRSPDRPNLTILSVTAPSVGEASVSANGRSIEYRPPLNQTGLAILTYTALDGSGAESIATVTVAILPVNDPPVASDDTFYVSPGSSDNLLDILANDNAGPDPGDRFNLVSVTQATAGGTVTVDTSDGVVIRYAPEPGFRGREFFSYTIRDAQGATAVGTVAVNVVPERARLQNAALPEDVDGNGRIEPIDALRIINDLNRFGTSDLVIERFELQSPPFYDVTGDDLISPLDALRVINFLNRNGLPSGEAGERRASRPAAFMPLSPGDGPLPQPMRARDSENRERRLELE